MRETVKSLVTIAAIVGGWLFFVAIGTVGALQLTTAIHYQQQARQQ